MRTEHRPPPRHQRQEDFQCPPWTPEIEAVAEQSATWPWQQPRPTSARQVLDTVPFAGRTP